MVVMQVRFAEQIYDQLIGADTTLFWGVAVLRLVDAAWCREPIGRCCANIIGYCAPTRGPS